MPKLKPKSKQAQIEDRRNKVAEKLLSGMTYREIAVALNVSVGTVGGDWKAILSRWVKEQVTDADARIQLQLRRTDRLINSIWKKATEGDLFSIDRVRLLMDKQDKYIGIGGDLVKLGGPNGEPLPNAPNVIVYIPDNGRGDVSAVVKTSPESQPVETPGGS